jgi:hypothetical protein
MEVHAESRQYTRYKSIKSSFLCCIALSVFVSIWFHFLSQFFLDFTDRDYNCTDHVKMGLWFPLKLEIPLKLNTAGTHATLRYRWWTEFNPSHGMFFVGRNRWSWNLTLIICKYTSSPFIIVTNDQDQF